MPSVASRSASSIWDRTCWVDSKEMILACRAALVAGFCGGFAGGRPPKLAMGARASMVMIGALNLSKGGDRQAQTAFWAARLGRQGRLFARADDSRPHPTPPTGGHRSPRR